MTVALSGEGPIFFIPLVILNTLLGNPQTDGQTARRPDRDGVVLSVLYSQYSLESYIPFVKKCCKLEVNSRLFFKK